MYEDIKRILENEKIKAVVDGTVAEMNRLCKELDVPYDEDLHIAMMFTFENIGEVEYRKSLGKIY